MCFSFSEHLSARAVICGFFTQHKGRSKSECCLVRKYGHRGVGTLRSFLSTSTIHRSTNMASVFRSHSPASHSSFSIPRKWIVRKSHHLTILEGAPEEFPPSMTFVGKSVKGPVTPALRMSVYLALQALPTALALVGLERET